LVRATFGSGDLRVLFGDQKVICDDQRITFGFWRCAGRIMGGLIRRECIDRKIKAFRGVRAHLVRPLFF
jgi:hypothetical protein